MCWRCWARSPSCSGFCTCARSSTGSRNRPPICNRRSTTGLDPSEIIEGNFTLSTNGNGVAATDGAATNGKARYQDDKVRVAIIGVGNCANSFVQGVHHYRDANRKERVAGLMHVDPGRYHVSDIEFTCASAVNKTKVAKDLGKAIWADPNN